MGLTSAEPIVEVHVQPRCRAHRGLDHVGALIAQKAVKHLWSSCLLESWQVEEQEAWTRRDNTSNGPSHTDP